MVPLNGPDFRRSESHRGQEPCFYRGREPERKKKRESVAKKIGKFVSEMFYGYDPWKAGEWHGTPEERAKLNKYLEDHRMTAPEVTSMLSERPF